MRLNFGRRRKLYPFCGIFFNAWSSAFNVLFCQLFLQLFLVISARGPLPNSVLSCLFKNYAQKCQNIQKQGRFILGGRMQNGKRNAHGTNDQKGPSHLLVKGKHELIFNVWFVIFRYTYKTCTWPSHHGLMPNSHCCCHSAILLYRFPCRIFVPGWNWVLVVPWAHRC